MDIKKKVVDGFKMEISDKIPKNHKIKIRLTEDESGRTLSLSDNDESIVLTVAFEEIERLMEE